MLAGRMAETVGGANAREVMPNGVLAELRKLYYDTASATSRHRWRHCGPWRRRATFCLDSDYPFVKTAAMIEELRHIQMSEGERDAIERGNALALLPRLRVDGRFAGSTH